MQVILVFMSAVLVNNFVLSRSLGICPFVGVSKRLETAFGMGVAVTFVMTLSAAFTFIVYNYILVPLDLEFLYTIAFVLIIASLVQIVEMYMKKSSPTLYQGLGIYLPLITTNCAVLGLAVLNIQMFSDSFLLAMVHAIGAAIGFMLALVLFAGIRERMAHNNIPASFVGMPIAMIVAGLMSMAFLGFMGLISI